MLIKLGSWEDNGYHDSYFYASVWNTETEQIDSIQEGSTAFGGGLNIEYGKLTSEILEKARVQLAEIIFGMLRKAEDNDVLEPNSIKNGVRVRLLVDHKNRNTERTDCDKCSGSGHWINPHNEEDKRECFACNGLGFHLKTVKGKMVKFEEGLSGEVFWNGSYNVTYREETRYDINTKVMLDDGRVMKAPLEKLRLDKEPLSDEELRERAEELSYNYNFNQVMGMKAWPTTNEALAFANHLEKETVK
jgi:hypothetical protein